MKKVSIIMPYYKKKLFFKKTLMSIEKQSYKKFEIIIIYDDTDLTEYYYLKKITKKNNKIKIILNKSNLGAGLSRNVGIKVAKGHYLAFCDCDDIWKKEKLETQINFMKKKKIDFSYTAYNVIDENDKILKKKYFKKKVDFKSLLTHCYLGLSTVVLKKNLLNRNTNFSNLKTKEDFVLWLRLAKKGTNMLGIDKYLTSWRKANNSLSSSVIQKICDGFRVYFKELKYNKIKSLFLLLHLSINSILK
tara:strand:+ start:181 stop:921 length:741 start_codon:yes stop_codon:yes gene_type:complete